MAVDDIVEEETLHISWDMELFNSAELFLEDGLEIASHW